MICQEICEHEHAFSTEDYQPPNKVFDGVVDKSTIDQFSFLHQKSSSLE